MKSLTTQISDLEKRVENMKYSQSAHEKEEALRKAKALAEIDADRDVVKTRIERERRLREYRATVDREAQQRHKDEAILANYNTSRGLSGVIEEEDEGLAGGGDGGQSVIEEKARGSESNLDMNTKEEVRKDDEQEEDAEYDALLGRGRRLGS